ncbi:MAG: MFS transporter [Chloroflexota bacterium]
MSRLAWPAPKIDRNTSLATLLPANRQLIFALLCCGSFVGAFNSLFVIPLLPLIVRDLGVDVSMGGLLVAAPTLVSAGTALWVGPAMDRHGRKPFVVCGLTLIGATMLLASVVPSFWMVVVLRAIAGLGMAGLMPATISAAGDYFPYAERGKAMGWAISANGVAPVVGVPLGSVLAGFTSWRWTFIMLASLSLVLALVLLRSLPTQTRSSDARAPRPSAWGTLRHQPVGFGVLAMGLHSACWFCILSFMAALFSDRFGLADWALGALNFTTGSAMMLGSTLGGRLADRFGKRMVLLSAGLTSTAFGMALTTLAPTISVAFMCLFLFALPNGARGSSSQAIMSELVPTARATVTSLSGAAGNLGAALGAGLAGLVVGVFGYTALGPVAGLLSLISLALFWAFVHERQPAPATSS